VFVFFRPKKNWSNIVGKKTASRWSMCCYVFFNELGIRQTSNTMMLLWLLMLLKRTFYGCQEIVGKDFRYSLCQQHQHRRVFIFELKVFRTWKKIIWNKISFVAVLISHRETKKPTHTHSLSLSLSHTHTHTHTGSIKFEGKDERGNFFEDSLWESLFHCGSF